MTSVQTFSGLTDELPRLLNDLTSCVPMRGRPPKDAKLENQAIYLFSEGKTDLYVGRSDNLNQRICQHFSGSHNRAPFAFAMARQEFEKLKGPTNLTRVQLEKLTGFEKHFKAARHRVKQMDWRWVHTPDPNLQYLFEFYAAIELKTKYNKFKTH